MTTPAPAPDAPLSIGLLLFPGLTQLDLTGPYEVFARVLEDTQPCGFHTV